VTELVTELVTARRRTVAYWAALNRLDTGIRPCVVSGLESRIGGNPGFPNAARPDSRSGGTKIHFQCYQGVIPGISASIFARSAAGRSSTAGPVSHVVYEAIRTNVATKTDLADLENRMLLRLGRMIAVAIGLIIAATATATGVIFIFAARLRPAALG
jgi:hypothetical protein